MYVFCYHKTQSTMIVVICRVDVVMYLSVSTIICCYCRVDVVMYLSVSTMIVVIVVLML